MLRRCAASRTLKSRSGRTGFARKRGDTVGTNPASHGLSRVPSSGPAGSPSAVMSWGCESVPDSASLSQLPESRSGPGGRRFKSCLPDQQLIHVVSVLTASGPTLRSTRTTAESQVVRPHPRAPGTQPEGRESMPEPETKKSPEVAPCANAHSRKPRTTGAPNRCEIQLEGE